MELPLEVEGRARPQRLVHGRAHRAPDCRRASVGPLCAAAGENDPEIIAWALRHPCALSSAGTIDIEPGSPRTPSSSRSTAGRETELISVEEFGLLTEAKVLVKEWGSGQFHVKK
jgi:hypothetical protein